MFGSEEQIVAVLWQVKFLGDIAGVILDVKVVLHLTLETLPLHSALLLCELGLGGLLLRQRGEGRVGSCCWHVAKTMSIGCHLHKRVEKRIGSGYTRGVTMAPKKNSILFEMM